MPELADAIFCRNVIIYFDRPRRSGSFASSAASWSMAATCSWAIRRACTTWTCRWCRWLLRSTGKLMAEIEIDLPEVHLQPGEIHLARSPAHPEDASGLLRRGDVLEPARGYRRALPWSSAAMPSGSARLAEGYRYVDFAIRDLVRQFERLWSCAEESCRSRCLEERTFLPVNSDDVLEGNGWPPELAHRAGSSPRARTSPCIASDLGGSVGRTIQFHTGTGEVFLRRLSHLTPEDQRHEGMAKGPK